MNYFPKRYRIYILVKNKEPKKIKFFDVKYIERVKEEYKQKYSPDNVEFAQVISTVKICDKPNKLFTVNYEWANIWGINTDNEYYVANKDFTKVKKLTIKNETIS